MCVFVHAHAHERERKRELYVSMRIALKYRLFLEMSYKLGWSQENLEANRELMEWERRDVSS